jgi:predicted enzyme related to lactoylglutathione lyase
MPPTPIPNVGHFAMFTDLDGHCIGLFKSDGGPMPEPPKRPGCPVTWWEIMSKDGKQAREFYGKLFDWPIKYDAAMDYGEVPPGEPRGIGGGIITTKDPAGQFTYVSFYTQVDDLRKYLDKAVSLGGKVMMESMPIPNVGTIAYFKDPEGRPMGLFKSQ